MQGGVGLRAIVVWRASQRHRAGHDDHGQGLGNGATIGGIVTRDEIADSMRQIHFNTFAGNPWATIQAAETLKILEEQNSLEQATRQGVLLAQGLKQAHEGSRLIGDVRSRGLMAGVELVKDRKTKAYASDETIEVLEEAKSRGLLIGKGGLYGNILRITPPMCVSDDDIRTITRIVGESVRAVEKRMA